MKFRTSTCGTVRPAALAVAIMLSFPTSPACASAYLEAIRAVGPRYENSAGAKHALSYIVSAVSAMNLRANIIEVGGPGEMPHSFSSSIEVVVPGKREERLVFVVPMEQDPSALPGQYDACLAAALTALEGLSRGDPPPLTVVFLFAGAVTGQEESRDGAPNDRYLLGARRYIEARRFAGKTMVACVLAIEREGFVPGMRNYSRGNVSPFWYYERALVAAERAGIRFEQYPDRIILFRLGICDEDTSLSPWLDAGIPAIELVSGSAADQVTLEDAIPAFVSGLVAANSQGFLERWDRHYMSINLFGFPLFLREQLFVELFVWVIGLIAAFFLAATLVARDRIRSFLASLPLAAAQTALACLAVAISLALSYAALLLAFEVSGSWYVWKADPGLFMFLVLCSSALVSHSLVKLLLRARVLAPGPSFYFAGSCVALSIITLASAWTSLSVAALFLVVLATLVPALVTRNRFALAAMGFLAMLPAVALLWSFASAGVLRLHEIFLFPSAYRTVALYLVMLPFALLLAGISQCFPSRDGSVPRWRVALPASLALASLAGLPLAGALYADSPPTAEVSLREVEDEDARAVTVAAEATRRGAVRLRRDGRELTLEPGVPVRLDAPSLAGRTLVSVSERASLYRRVMRITVVLPADAERVELALVGDSEVVFYSCDYPYVQSLDGTRVEISVGARPSQRLEVEMVVDEAFSGYLDLRIRYDKPFSTWEVEDGRTIASAKVEVVKRVRIEARL